MVNSNTFSFVFYNMTVSYYIILFCSFICEGYKQKLGVDTIQWNSDTYVAVVSWKA